MGSGPALQGKKVVVFGLAKSGIAATELLLREGAKVTAIDQRSLAELGTEVARLQGKGVTFALGATPVETLKSADVIVTSPGVPLALPELQAARGAGVKIWGEVELASRFISGRPVVGITGTNGKSTTTALCGELFKQAGRKTFVGGNLGRPLSDGVLKDAFDAFVVELSSFQLESIESMRLNAAVILNLTPDHLDRYASHAEYGAAKARIFMNQAAGDVAVVNADDPETVKLAAKAKVPVYGFTLGRGGGAFQGRAAASGGGFTFDFGDRPTFALRNKALRGEHNVQNAMAAALLAFHSGVDAAAIQQGLDSYPGLPHRLEFVRVLDGVEWINDSKATNVDSSLVALRAFSGNLWLIAGGRGKGAPYAPMVDASKGKVKGVLTIGEDAKKIEDAYRGGFAVRPCETLEKAIAQARELAKSGDVILLSPACASYDQFKNFEDRGETFKRLVRALR